MKEEIDRWALWKRNVLDKYKDISNADIKAELKKTALPCAVLCSQVAGDFNFSCIIRSANNFNVKCVYYFGRKRFDRRGAQGCYHYSDVIFLPTIEEIKALKQEYVFVGLENNIPGTTSIKDFKYSINTLFVFGEEGIGIPKELIDLLDYKVEIPSRGSIRSLNIASAASIALYDYTVKTNL